jgi:hypothetical protein
MVAQAVFHHKGFALVEGRVVPFNTCLNVLRVNAFDPTVAKLIFHPFPGEL